MKGGHSQHAWDLALIERPLDKSLTKGDLGAWLEGRLGHEEGR
jgi:hypothetical protein